MSLLLAGAALGLGSAIFGGLSASSQRRKMQRQLNKANAENQSWYNANALGDYTQRADAQNLMAQLRNTLNRQNKAAANTAVITGATPEAQAAAKERSNKVLTDTFSRIGAMGQQYKDRVTDRYLERKQQIMNGQMGMWNGAAESGENLMGNGLDMLTKIGVSYLDNQAK